MKSSTVINKNSYKVNPDLYTSDYYLSDGYAGALQYKSGLHQLAPSVEYVYDRIPPGNGKQKLLDAGCGKGELMYFVSRKRYMPFGVDYSATAVRMASALMKAKGIDSAVVRKEDVRHLSFRSSFFDIVVSTDVLEHLDDNRAGLAFIDEAYRVLKPGGRLIIHTAPNHDHVEYFVRYYQRYVNFLLLNMFYQLIGSGKRQTLELRNAYDRVVHVNEQTYQSLIDLFEKSKFRVYRLVAFGDPFKFNVFKLPYYLLVYLYPLNRVFPFSKLLANHFYVFAEKR